MQENEKEVLPTELSMGDQDDDVDNIWIRRCCDHVYGDLIHLNKNTTCPSIQADENRPSESSQVEDISSVAPQRLQCLPVLADELLYSPTQLETDKIVPMYDVIPVIVEECTSCDLPRVQGTTSSSSPLPIDESKSNESSALVDETATSYRPQADESTSSSSPQVDHNKIIDPTPVDESSSSNPPQVTCPIVEDKERASTSRQCHPPRDYFVTGYVVRDRKSDRHVPVVNPTSLKDDQLLARANFDILNEIENMGHVQDMFWPQPGDILVLQSHRSDIPYPGFDGHVELYVDEYYFQNSDYTWNWAYDFREGDILIRCGTFSTHWRWSPEDSVQVYLRFDGCFVLVGREVNHEFCLLDFKFSDPVLRPIHSIQVDFHPRLGDLIVRKDSATPFNWTLFWWKEAFYVSEPFDMLVRAGFVNSDDNIHCFAVAEVYFRNSQNQHWSFQGRDDYTFGGGT